MQPWTQVTVAVVVFFLENFIAGGLELGAKLDLGCSGNIILSAMMCWGVFNFHGVLIFNFFGSLLF